MFIAIDGLDGCGKSSAAEAVRAALIAEGRRVTVREHPSDRLFGRMCQAMLLKRGKLPVAVASVLLFSDMLGTSRLARLSSRRDEDLIAVRYGLSCYFLHERPARIVHRLFVSFMCAPDLDIVIDVEPEVAVARISRRGLTEEVFENPRSMARARAGMLSVPGISVVDGGGSMESTSDGILSLIRSGRP